MRIDLTARRYSSGPSPGVGDLWLCSSPLRQNFILANLRSHNSPGLILADYQIWSMMQDRVYQMPVEDVADLRQRLIDARCKALSTILLIDGVRLQAFVGEKEAS